MCKSKSEPGGPVRCSYHASEILRGAKARLAQEHEEVEELTQNVEHLAQALELLERREQRTTDHAARDIIEDRIERVEATQATTIAELEKHIAKRDQWQAKVKKAQKELDATRGGLEKLSREINDVNKRIEELEGGEADPKEGKSVQEELVQLRQRRSQYQVRFENGRNKLRGEHPDDGEYQNVDNSKDAPDTPDGDESDDLIDPQLNEALNHMIDDLDLSAVDKKFDGLVDPDTGESITEHEMQVFSRRRRHEARARVKRAAQINGDNKEMLRSFLRHAIYRALRHSKATRKITRLIGVGHFNSFLNKFDEVRDERKRERLLKKRDKWHGNRMKHLDDEEHLIEKQYRKDAEQYEERKASLKEKYDGAAFTQKEYDKRVAELDEEFEKRTDIFEHDRAHLHTLRAEWEEERLRKARERERREEEVRQALIEKKRQRESLDEAILDAHY